MSISDWLRKKLGQKPSQEMVPFLDPEIGRVVQIPASELRPGAVRVHLQNTNEVVWVLAEQLRVSEIKHPEFEEEIREYIRQIQDAFAEHRPLSFEEWEEGFRRDNNPEREIALWLHTADVYTAFADDEPDVGRRDEIYACIIACLTTGRDAVWHVFQPKFLSRAEAEQIVSRFFGKG
jgi:hypothetical protein